MEKLNVHVEYIKQKNDSVNMTFTLNAGMSTELNLGIITNVFFQSSMFK